MNRQAERPTDLMVTNSYVVRARTIRDSALPMPIAVNCWPRRLPAPVAGWDQSQFWSERSPAARRSQIGLTP